MRFLSKTMLTIYGVITHGLLKHYKIWTISKISTFLFEKKENPKNIVLMGTVVFPCSFIVVLLLAITHS